MECINCWKQFFKFWSRQKEGSHYIIITGENFGDPFSYVTFKGIPHLAEGSVVRATYGEIEVIIPSKAISGKAAYNCFLLAELIAFKKVI